MSEYRDPRIAEAKMFELSELIKRVGYDNPEVANRYYQLRSREGLEPNIVSHFEKLFNQLIPADGITIDSEKKPLSDCTVLEFGSGPGHVSEVLADKFGQVIAVDKAQAMVDFVNDKFSSGGKIRALRGEFGGRIPAEDQSVEAVVSLNTLDELLPQDEDNYLKEIARVVKSGGFALINRVVAANNLAMKDKFERERKSEIENLDPNYPQRQYVFINSTLEERLKGLLKNTGIEPTVESMDDPADHRYSVVKITFIKSKSNEA